MQTPLLSPTLISILDNIKSVAAYGGAGYSIYKFVRWASDIRDKDVPELRTAINSVAIGNDKLHTEMKDQTTAIVSELKELRADFRSYLTPRVYAAKAAKKGK